MVQGVELLPVLPPSESQGELASSSSSDSRLRSLPPLLQVPNGGVQRFPGPPAAPQSLHPQAASQGHYPPPKPAFWNPVAKGNAPWQPQTAERKSLAPHEFQARTVSHSTEPWYTHGTPMVHPWCTHGAPMFQPWSTVWLWYTEGTTVAQCCYRSSWLRSGLP